MNLFVYVYIPPTPTPLAAPAAAPVFIDPSSYSVWSFTDETVMLWNESNRFSVGVVIQIAILLLIIGAFVFIAIKWLNSFSDGDAQ